MIVALLDINFLLLDDESENESDGPILQKKIVEDKSRNE